MKRELILFSTAALTLLGCTRDSNTLDDSDAKPLSWALVEPGSTYETRTTTSVTKDATGASVSKHRHTLVSKTDQQASLQMESSTDGVGTSSDLVQVPLQGSVPTPDCPELTFSITRERCTVPAGTFDCEKKTMEMRQGDVVRSTSTWTAAGIPIPVKWTLQNEGITSTSELTSIGRK